MKIIDSKKAYKAPKAKVVEVNVYGVLCQSPSETDWFTEGFTHSQRSFGDDDWE